MKRINTFELEDQPWFPASFRNLMMETLQVSLTFWEIYRPVVPLLKRVMEHMQATQVIDLCSGGAGPWVQLVEPDWPTSVTLTDKYPNVEAFQQMAAQAGGQIDYVTDPVDATHVPSRLRGVRTMFTAFHHFSPPAAAAILQDVVDQESAICIFEIVERRPRNLFFVPLLTFPAMYLLTPSVKKLTFEKLFWTYVVPAVPLLGAWDAFASNVRAYSPRDLKELVHSVQSAGFVWEIGQIISPKAKIPVTYLLGYPQNPGES
jgi:hypothetical protein